MVTANSPHPSHRRMQIEELLRKMDHYRSVRGPAFNDQQWKVQTDAAVMVADWLLEVWPLSDAEGQSHHRQTREALEAHARKLNELAREFRENVLLP